MAVLSENVLILLYFLCYVLKQGFLFVAMYLLQLGILSHESTIRLVQLI